MNDHTEGEIATILNRRGYRTGYGQAFNQMLVKVVRVNYALKSRRARLRERGLLTAPEVADRLGVHHDTVYRLRRAGLLRGHACNDRPGAFLFEIPDPLPNRKPGRSPKQARSPELADQRSS